MASDPSLAASWLLQPVEQLQVAAPADDGFFRVKMSHNGTCIFACSGRGLLHLWDFRYSITPIAELELARSADVDDSVIDAVDSQMAAIASRGRMSLSGNDARLAVVRSEKILTILDVGSTFEETPETYDIDHGHEEWPELAWSPDGMLLAMWLPPVNRLRRYRVGGKRHPKEGRVLVLSANRCGALPLELDHSNLEVRSVAWSANSKMLLTWCFRHMGGKSGSVYLWDVSVDRVTPVELNHEGAHVCHAAWSPKSLDFATVCTEGKVHVWDALNPGTPVFHVSVGVSGGSIDLQDINWSPDGSYIASSAVKAGVRVCGAHSDDDLLFELRHGSGTNSVLESNSQRLVFRGCQLESLRPPCVWEVRLGGKAAALELRHSNITEAMPTFESIRSWAPDSTRIVVLSRGTRRLLDRSQQSQASEVWIWRITFEAAPIAELTSLKNCDLHDIAWSPDSRLIVTACVDGTSCIFDGLSGSMLSVLGNAWNVGAQMSFAKGAVMARFMPCGRRIAVLTRIGRVGDAEEGDSLCLFGPDAAVSAYRSLMLSAKTASALPANRDSAIHGALRLLSCLQGWSHPGEELGLQQMASTLRGHANVIQCCENDNADVGDATPLASVIEQARRMAHVQAAAIWSCEEEVLFCGKHRSFSWLVNFAIDVGDPTLLDASALFMLCFDYCEAPFCKVGILRTWRGGGFNEDWCSHFTLGTRHRIPAYVSTCLERSACCRFMEAALRKKEAAVEWCIEIPDNFADLLVLAGGREFVLKPYAVVEVVDVQWHALREWPFDKQQTSCEIPHRITLRVQPETAFEFLDVPVAPWR